MSAILVTSATTPNSTEFASAFYEVVRNLGLCIFVTEKLQSTLRLNSILQSVVSVLGITGAALSLRVTCSRSNRSSVSAQVAILSVYDLIYLSSVLVMSTLILAGVNDPTTFGICHLVRRMGHWGVTYSMVDITVARCLSMAKPFFARKFRRITFTLQRSAVILVVGLVLICPFTLEVIFGYSEEPECRGERSLTTYGLVFSLYIGILLFYLLPFLWIIAANIRLIYALRQVSQHHRHVTVGSSSADPSSSTKQLSVFVVGLCVWYSACMLLPSTLFLVRLTRVELFIPEQDLIVAAWIDSLIVLSTAANFLFYFLMWRNFRHSFLRIFCTRCCTYDVNFSCGATELRTIHLSLADHEGHWRSLNSRPRMLHYSNTVSTRVSDQ